eukprot:2380305-Prymnesium_polylepis.1
MGGGPGTMDILIDTIDRPGFPVAIILVVEACGAAAAVDAYLRDGALPDELSNFASRRSDLERIKRRNEAFAGEMISPYRCHQAHHFDLG